MSQARQSLPRSQRGAPPFALEIESGLFSTSQHDTIHTLFAPLHYEPGYPYPLVVWLHGTGCDERQLLRIMPLVSMRNYVAVAPRGVPVAPRVVPVTPQDLPAGPQGFPVAPQGLALAPRGGAVHPRGGTSRSTSEGVAYGWSHAEHDLHQAEQRIFDSIEMTFRRFNVDPRRIFLAGFDTGGTMAFRVAMNHPYKFAGVLSLGGCLPTGGAPLARLPEARQLAVFLAAGRHSSVYNEKCVCDDLRLLHTAGMSITLRLYPCGHELSPQMLSDVDRWIIEIITASKDQAEANPKSE